MPLDLQLLGAGVYTPRQAARLAGAGPRDVLRWTRGGGNAKPLWRAHYLPLDGSTELSFRDMLEVRVIARLRRAGVSMQAVRFAIGLAEESFGIDRPLSSRRFRTDGSEILLEALDGAGELTSLSRRRPGQMAWKAVVEQSLVDLEFDGDDPVLWRPHKFAGIVIDPARAFGDPILDAAGLSTAAIRTEVEAGIPIARVARLYEIEVNEANSALAFERALDGQRPL